MLSLVVSLALSAASREAVLLEDGKDGALDQVSFAEAALIASGVPDAELATSLSTLQSLLEPARQAAVAIKDPQRRARVLLEALHERTFRSYRLEATTLQNLWSTGEYNCLSSSVAYLIAGEGLLDSPRGVLSVRHALVQVTVGGKAFDVQTTVRSGFGMPRKQMLSAEHLSRIARPGEDLAIVEKEIVDAEEVPVIALIGGLYANRAVLALRNGEVSIADGLLNKASALAAGKSKGRFGVWRAALVNDSAVQLSKAGRFEEAARALESVMETSGTHRPALKRNWAIFQYELARAASKQGDWAQALQRAEAAKAAGLENTEALLGEAKGKVAASSGSCASTSAKERVRCLVSFSQEKTKAGDREAALAAARQAHALAPTDPEARYAVYETEFPRLQALAKAGEACDEVAVLGKTLEDLVRGLTEQPVENEAFTVVCFSMRAQRSFDAGEYERAAADFRRALTLDPRNETARHNLEASEVNLAIRIANEGNCDEARAVLGRGTPKARWKDVLEYCWVNVTAKLGAAKEWRRAITAARRGLQDVPDSKDLRTNLLASQQTAALEASKAGRCDEVATWVRELEPVAPEFAEKLSRSCR